MATHELFSLDGRTALVTGARQGIGQAIAAGLAEAGADVVLLARDPAVDDTVARIEAAGAKAEVVVADIADAAATEAAVSDLLDRRQIDILVNNAGVVRRGPAVDVSPADWADVVRVNLDAVWQISQLVGRPMVSRGAGKIISLASLLSFQGGVLVPAYAATKHAVAGVTKALANEWAAHGVQVNAIAPGYIGTEFTKVLREDAQRGPEITSRIPAGRWGDPEDLVGPAVFLASSASDYVNGHLLVVDGGWMAR